MHQRLFEIVYFLTQQGSATANQLAEKFSVSRRTLYRDIDVLSLAGIPVYTEKGRTGGIFILPEYVLDKSLFSKAEQSQLVAHFQSLASIGTPDTQQVLDKLASVFGKRDNWLEVDFAPWGGGEQMRLLFRSLREAILKSTLLNFDYQGTSPVAENRTVEPYTIIFRGQGWYLRAFCHTRQDFRFFKLSRIRNLKEMKETFSPRELPSSANTDSFTGPMSPFRLHFIPSMAYRVFDEFLPEEIHPQQDGSFIVATHFPLGEWLTGYLISYGPGLTVLEPASIVSDIKTALASTLQNYS